MLGWLAFAAPSDVLGQVNEWNAAPGCPAPHDLSLVTTNAPQTKEQAGVSDDVVVRVTVTAQPEGWRALLEATDHTGQPLGERVLEHTTCEELNRVVLVSLSVFLATQTPVAAPEERPPSPTVDPAPPVPAPPPPVATSAIPAPASTAGTPQPTPTPLTQGVRSSEPFTAQDSAPTAPSRALRGSSPTVELLPGIVGAVDSTVATSAGGELSMLLNLGEWGARVTGNWRTSIGAAAEDPDVEFSVASTSFAGCRYLSASRGWLVCVGPLLERLTGFVPSASRPEASAWLAGAKFGLTTLQRRETRAIGWFLDFQVHLRRGAMFQVGAPSATIFEYSSLGALLTLGPDIHL